MFKWGLILTNLINFPEQNSIFFQFYRITVFSCLDGPYIFFVSQPLNLYIFLIYRLIRLFYFKFIKSF